MPWKHLAIMTMVVLAFIAWVAPQPQAYAQVTVERPIQEAANVDVMLFAGDDSDIDPRTFGEKVMGVWYNGDYTIPGGPSLVSPVTVYSDGTYESNTTIDQGANLSGSIYGNYMGCWSQIGSHQMSTLVYNFGFARTGELVLTAQYKEIWTFNTDFTSAQVATEVGWWLTPVDLTHPPPMDGSFADPVPSTVQKWILNPQLGDCAGEAEPDNDLLERIAGVWYNGSEDFGWVVGTYNADGTQEANSTVDIAPDFSGTMIIWSNVRGVVVPTGENSAYSEFIIFGFDFGNGVWTWTVRGEQLYCFNEAGTELTIEQSNFVYLPGQNPLDPDDVPLGPFEYPTSYSYKWVVEPPEVMPVVDTSGGVQAADDDEVMYTGEGFGRWANGDLVEQVAGLWYTHSFAGDGQVLFVINADGTVEGNSTLDQGIFDNKLFSNVRAAIVQTGKRTAFDNGFIFAFDAETGVHDYTTRTNALFTFHPNLKTGIVRQYNELFSTDQNPFDPDEVPYFTTDELVYPIYRLSKPH